MNNYVATTAHTRHAAFETGSILAECHVGMRRKTDFRRAVACSLIGQSMLSILYYVSNFSPRKILSVPCLKSMTFDEHVDMCSKLKKLITLKYSETNSHNDILQL